MGLDTHDYGDIRTTDASKYMVFTVEPGIYIHPLRGLGLDLEDDVIVQENWRIQ